MNKKQFSFYATKSDLTRVLNKVANNIDFKFACLVDENDMPNCYTNVSQIEDFSIAKFGNQNNEQLFLIIEDNVTPKVRTVKQRRGGTKKFLDQLSHPESVILRPGGIMKDENSLIAGSIGTVSENKWSKSLYRALFSCLKKDFNKIKSFYIGEEAEKMFDDGCRLTTNLRMPETYNLTR